MKQYLERSMTYSEYIALIDRVIAECRTTGLERTESRTSFTKLNRQRMSRLGKTILPDAEAGKDLAANRRRQLWLVLTEGWCGDAAQNIPAIEQAADLSDLIETRYILRDENLDLMDEYLTGGARAIPKLIAIDAGTHEVLFTWGSRPAAAQKLFADRKAQGIEKAVINEELQRWYNADRGLSVQRELAGLVAAHQEQTAAAAN